ncbi:glyoxalase [Bacillus cereus]|uniref:Glyoxalase n=1 Tax=Bacillus cereus TaxID=1396 RepID=A0A1S9TZL9_BACCE|nr:hypothetical protein B4083_0980 [Bacillus cereus]OOR14931.1 glyoxalase [Bacillus cereus]OOR62859.1 glyoxalase [Bacillus mycoides]QBP91838.1 glyoxalase [Bacillus mycoides]QWG85159.1 glyoxalase [Bacillus mycoides]
MEGEVVILEVDGDRIELLTSTNNIPSPMARFINKKVLRNNVTPFYLCISHFFHK